MRRTKIVCTLGPSSNTTDVIRRLVKAGMNVARLNFSHGSHAQHKATFDIIREVEAELETRVAILADLQGPKIRTGSLSDGKPVELITGNNLCLTTRGVPGNVSCISTSYQSLPADVSAGDRLLLADGTLELRVDHVEGDDVQCVVVRGGMLGEHKGINLPGIAVSSPCLTDKDLADLPFCLGLGVDYVALSFVRAASDIIDLKRRIKEAGSPVRIVAKIERPEALECFDTILEETDVVMVARGDLGVEVDFEEVPQIQKRLIAKCNAVGVPVITATQMLESMTEHSRPTRAEVTDVANAIYDGTDAVMLSGETAVGTYPVEAVRAMASIAEKADEATAAATDRRAQGIDSRNDVCTNSFNNAIGQAAWRMCLTLDVKGIVGFTMSGYTAASIARYRPPVPIIAATSCEETSRRCALYWGVDSFLCDEVENTDKMVEMLDHRLLESGFAREGDIIIVVAGTPLAVGGRTNFLKLHKVGDEV